MQLTAYKVFFITDFCIFVAHSQSKRLQNIHKASSTLCSLNFLNVGNSNWLSMALQRRCHG